jgi:hypothetical protein
MASSVEEPAPARPVQRRPRGQRPPLLTRKEVAHWTLVFIATLPLVFLPDLAAYTLYGSASAADEL